FAIVFSGRGGAAEVLRNFAPGLIGLRFDRGQEAEADAGGMDMLNAAGIPGDGMVRFFKELSKQESGTERALNFASDHPTSQGRFETLERLRSSRPAPPPVDWGLDWGMVRERCLAAHGPQP
ncbi:MAG: M48 family metalloprotease, partial [Elusimicrobia bacterium]|nr:M48 family metalloprotease [Elusimicrobiota bacterium]